MANLMILSRGYIYQSLELLLELRWPLRLPHLPPVHFLQGLPLKKFMPFP